MIRSGAINTLSGAFRAGLSIVTIPLLIRLLGLPEFGLWTIIMSIVGLLAVAEAGLPVALTVFISSDLSRDDKHGIAESVSMAIAGVLFFSSVATAIVFIFAPQIASLFNGVDRLYTPHLVLSLQIVCGAVWLRALQQLFSGIQQAYQKYGTLNAINTVQAIIQNVGLICIAFLGGTIEHLAVWFVICSGLGASAHGVVASRLTSIFRHRPTWTKRKARQISSYSAATWLTTLSGTFFVQGDRLLVGALLGPSMVAIYAVIANLAVQINTFSALATEPLLPRISAHIARNQVNNAEMTTLAKLAALTNTFVALLMGIVLITIAPWILPVLLPVASATTYVPIAQLSFLIYALYSLNACGYFILIGVRKVKQLMLIQFGSSALALALIIIGAQYGSLGGAVFGNAGYLGVTFLSVVGFRSIGVDFVEWLKWIGGYVCLFFILAAIAFTSQSVVISSMLLIVVLAFYGLKYRDVAVRYLSSNA